MVPFEPSIKTYKLLTKYHSNYSDNGIHREVLERVGSPTVGVHKSRPKTVCKTLVREGTSTIPSPDLFEYPYGKTVLFPL